MLLWDVLARSSAVLVVAALTNAALRGRSAALRHAVWACGLAGALAVAPLSWILPTWHVPLLPALAAAPESTAAVAAAADVALEPASTAPDGVAPRRACFPGSRPAWPRGSRRGSPSGFRPASARAWRRPACSTRPTMAGKPDGNPGAPPAATAWSDAERPARRRAALGHPAVRRLGARHAAAARTPGHRQPRDVPGAADPGDRVGAVGRDRAPPGAALRRPAHAVRAGRVDHHADGRRLSPADRRPAGRGGRLARRARDVGPPPRARPHPPPRLPDAARRQHHLRALLDEPAGLVRRPRPAARTRAGL